MNTKGMFTLLTLMVTHHSKHSHPEILHNHQITICLAKRIAVRVRDNSLERRVIGDDLNYNNIRFEYKNI